MITFIKTMSEGKSRWMDASGNQIRFNHALFNQTRLKGTYEGNEVFYTIADDTREDNSLIGSAITMNLSEPIPFKAPCYSFQLTDAEFVRAVTLRCIEVVAPSSLIYVD